MKPIPYEPGRVVVSTQGRDKGKAYMIVEIMDEAFVNVCDGDARKLDKPKKKRIKHLRARPYVLTELMNQLAAGRSVQNGELKKQLKSVLNNQHKEECALVQE